MKDMILIATTNGTLSMIGTRKETIRLITIQIIKVEMGDFTKDNNITTEVNNITTTEAITTETITIRVATTIKIEIMIFIIKDKKEAVVSNNNSSTEEVIIIKEAGT